MSSIRPKHYDAFLSFNSEDRRSVQEVAGRLKGEGLELYLDAWELAPGREVQPALAEALHASKTCVVFLGPNGLGPWQKQELQVAIDKVARDEAFHVIPVLLPGAERPRRGDVAHLEFLINASWVEFLKTLDDERAFRSLVWGITGTKRPPPDEQYEKGVCPYRGLEAFRPEDAKFFFGRENLTGWLVSALRREVRAAQGVRFLGVLGPSGSGKSSLVLAGLVPKLKEGAIEGSERWPVVIVRPWDNPLERLTEKVVPALRAVRPDSSLSELGEQNDLLSILRAEGDAASALNRYVGLKFANEPDDRRLVIVTDQFEEIFTYRPPGEQARARFEKDRDRFFANLLLAAAAPAGRVAVVLTMRSDFLSACTAFPQLAAVLGGHQVLVGPMTREELREAVERPAYLVDREVEPALAERLLADVAGQAGALPLLQFALTEVWKKQDVGRLTLRAYEESGGIAGALEHRANKVYEDLSAEAQDDCRRVFLRLVQPGEGTEDTKRRVSYKELAHEDPTRAAAVRRLIEKLADGETRLLTTEGDAEAGWTVEVAHEALLRNWARLQKWLQDEREWLPIRRRLTADAGEWADAAPEHQDDYLYFGVRLAVCREWAGPRRGDLNPVEKAFLDASEEAGRQREQKELADERRQREAAEAAERTERRRAEEAEARKRDAEAAARRQKRLHRRWRIAAVVALILAVTAAGLAKLAYDASTEAKNNEQSADKEKKRAEAQAVLADSRRLAALSESLREKRLDLALLLAVEAVGTKDTFETRNNLFKVVQTRPALRSFLHCHEGGVSSVALSEDGTALAAGYLAPGVDLAGGVVVWDRTHGTRHSIHPRGMVRGDVTGVALSLDGKTLVARYEKGGVRVWERAEGQWGGEALLNTPDGVVTGVALSRDGNVLVAGYAHWPTLTGGVVVRNRTNGKWQDGPTVAVAEGGVTGVAIRNDGKALAASYHHTPSRKGGVAIFNYVDGKWVRMANRPAPVDSQITSVAFDRGGETLAAGYQNEAFDVRLNGVVIWAKTGEVRLEVPDGRVTSVVFGPTGTVLAAGYAVPAGRDGGGVLWQLTRGKWQKATSLEVGEGEVRGVAFSHPEGKTLVAGYAADERPEGAPRGGVVEWETAGGPRPATTSRAQGSIASKEAKGEITAVAFSPTGKSLAAGYSHVPGIQGGLVICELRGGKWANRVSMDVPGCWVNGVAYSGDGNTLAVACDNIGEDGCVVVWKLVDGTWQGGVRLTRRKGAATGVALNHEGTILAEGYKDARTLKGGVVTWEWTDGGWRNTGTIGVPGRKTCVALSPNGKLLAAGYEGLDTFNGGVMVWGDDAGKWRGGERLKMPFRHVTSVAFGPDGTSLGAGFEEEVNGATCGGVAVWKWEGGKWQDAPLLKVSEGPVRSVAFGMGQEQTLAAGYAKRSRGGVVVWVLADGKWQVRESLKAFKGGVASVAFSDDGNTLAAGDDGGGLGNSAVIVFAVGLTDRIRLARQVANRKLTFAEWKQYFPDAREYDRTFRDVPDPPDLPKAGAKE
jgi:WD40 repeat protein